MTVTVEGLKAHLTLDGEADDALLAILIAEAKAWIAGYIDAEFPETDTPAALDAAARQLAAHWFETRGDTEAPAVPPAVPSLCAPFVVYSF